MTTATPQRTCRVCRSQRPKAELTRWVREGEQWQEDATKTQSGRGYYTCSEACAKKIAIIPPRSKGTR